MGLVHVSWLLSVWTIPLNVPRLLPGNSSRENLLSRVSAGLHDASGAELCDLPVRRIDRTLRLPPTFYAEVRSSNCVEVAPSGLCLSEAETVRAEFWRDGGGEKLSSRTDSSSDGEWIKTKCLLQSGGEAVTRRQMSPTVRGPSLLKPFPPQIIIRNDITEAIFPKEEPAEGILHAALFSTYLGWSPEGSGPHGSVRAQTHAKIRVFSMFPPHLEFPPAAQDSQQLSSARLRTELCKYLVSNYLGFFGEEFGVNANVKVMPTTRLVAASSCSCLGSADL